MEFMKCSWQGKSEEIKAKYPEATEYHKGHTEGHLGDCDSWECICGNNTNSDGFYPCDEQGNMVEPDLGGPWTDKYVCERCGRIIRQGDGAVVGRKGSDKEKEFVKAAENFKEAALALGVAWEHLPKDSDYIDKAAKNYPFAESFDEMVLRILDWYHSVVG